MKCILNLIHIQVISVQCISIFLYNFRDAATGKSKNWTALAVKRGGDVRTIHYILYEVSYEIRTCPFDSPMLDFSGKSGRTSSTTTTPTPPPRDSSSSASNRVKRSPSWDSTRRSGSFRRWGRFPPVSSNCYDLLDFVGNLIILRRNFDRDLPHQWT